MNDRDTLREDRLTRTQTFRRENRSDFAPGSKADLLFNRVDQHLLDLAAAKIGQIPGRASKTTLLDALWLDYKNIARTSRSIGAAALGGSIADYAMPEDFTEALIKTQAEKLLHLLEDNNAPVSEGGDTPEQKAAKAARRALFLEWEIQSDFVEDLRADYNALITANRLNQAENQEVSKTPPPSTKSSSPQAKTSWISTPLRKTNTRVSPKNSAPGSPPAASTAALCGRRKRIFQQVIHLLRTQQGRRRKILAK